MPSATGSGKVVPAPVQQLRLSMPFPVRQLPVLSPLPVTLVLPLPILPFLVLAIVLALGLAMGAGEDSPRFAPYLRAVGGTVYGVVLLLIVASFAYFYPVLAAYPIDEGMWRDRLWFDVWIYGSGGS